MSFSRATGLRRSDTHLKWSNQAGVYSREFAPLTESHCADLVSILRDDLLQAKTVLDIGCGTGSFAKAYLQHFPNGVPGQTFILSDISAGMLEKAKDNVKPGSGFRTEIKFQEEDARKLEGIADDSIDVVVSLFSACLLPDQEDVRKAVQRVLSKPNGVFALSSYQHGLSESLAAQGFGVSVQDAFVAMHHAIDPSYNPLPTAWATRDSGCKKLSESYQMKNVETFGTLHTSVWEFEALWAVFCENPFSNIKGAAEEDVKRAKAVVIDFVTQGGKLSLDMPLMLCSGSNLIVGRGI